MTVKILSIFTGLGVLDVYLQGLYNPSGPLFLFISDNKAVAILRALIVGSLVAISFKDKFWNWLSYVMCAGGGILLTTIGLLGMFDTAVAYGSYEVLKPLDYILSLEVGICLALCSLTLQHSHFTMPFKHQLLIAVSLFSTKIPRHKMPNVSSHVYISNIARRSIVSG